jgi:symplekin
MKEALTKQKERMDTAFATEQAERRARREGRAGGVLGKHPADAESSLDAMKRAKIEPVEPMNVAFPGPPIVATGREIDISPLPERFVIDAVMRGLQAISAEVLTRILEVSVTYRTMLIRRRTVRLFNRVDRTRYLCCARRFCLKAQWIKRKRK